MSELEEIKSIVYANRRSWRKLLEKRNDLMEYIRVHTPSLISGEEYKLSTKLYWLFNGLTEFPRCKECEKNEHYIGRDVINVFKGYYPFCSNSCGSKNKETQIKHENTNIRVHGVKSTNSLKSVIAKKQKTIAENHGNGDLKLAYKNIHAKGEKTCELKYGVKNTFQTEECRKRRKEVCEEKFGTEWTLQNEDNQRKCREAKIEKFGCDPMKIRSVVEKMLHTRWDLKSDDELKEIIDRANATKKKNRYNAILSTETIPLFSIDEFNLRDYDTKYRWKCLKCGNNFEAPLDCSLYSVSDHKVMARCPICHPPCPNGVSKEEIEVAEFVGKFVDVIQNDRKILNGKELDIYVPSKKLAIEFDGLYWHSDNNSESQNRHLDKTNLCEKLGIHLIHIFENEWLHNRHQVEYRLKNLLGVYDKTIYARQCEVKEVYGDDSVKFQDANHLQGHSNAKVSLGLYHDGELVSLMTFSKPRFNKKYEWELVRFCNKCGYHIPGGASKLLKHFERTYHPKSIVSYADRRWSMNNGNTLYDRLGFLFDHISKPNYWYWNTENRDYTLYSRILFQKHKLKGLLDKFDESKSEWQNMQDNGYDRIFDCGNLVFVKSYDLRNSSLVV